MKIKEGFILRKVANTDIVIPIGNNIANFNGIISLNQSAAFLWEQLKKGSDIPQLITGLIQEFGISREQAQKDAELFVEQLQNAKILEENIS